MQRIIVAMLLLGLAVGCGGNELDRDVPSAQPSATAPRADAQLAVLRTVTGNPPRRDIVVFAASGRLVRTLVRGVPGSFLEGGGWSPDGTAFAYASGGDTRTEFSSDIYLIEAASGGVRQLTSTGAARAPVWSPDGRSIIFSEFRRTPRFPPTASLWSIDVVSGNRRHLLPEKEGAYDIASSFSPNGSQLAFTRGIWSVAGGLKGTYAAYLLDLQTLEVRKLADRAAGPAFSPDGRRIAYASDRDENGKLSYGDSTSYANELYVMEADGGDPRRLTRTRDLNEGAPSWSQDGQQIALVRGQVVDNAQGFIVLVVRSDGSCARRVAFDPGLGVWYSQPAFRPGQRPTSPVLSCRPAKPLRPAPVPPAGNLTLAQARAFRPFQLFWLGPRWGGLILSSISSHKSSGPRGRAPVVNLHYGRLSVQLWSACARVPAAIDQAASGATTIRGAKAFFFEGGSRLELVAGKTTVVLFGNRRNVVRAAKALRPVSRTAPPASGYRLPRPARGAVAGKLRCR